MNDKQNTTSPQQGHLTGVLAALQQALHAVPPVWSRVSVLTLVFALAFVVLSVFNQPFKNLEQRLGTLGWTLSPDYELENAINVVAIDERSIDAVGAWPWSREDMARLVTAIDATGAQLQLHDIAYPEARPGDDVFLAALQQSNSAILAQVPQLPLPGSDTAVTNQAPVVRTGSLSHPVSGVSCAANSGVLPLPVADQYVASHANFAAVPKGHITSVIDSDGAVRKTPALVCVDGQAYPALALTAFLSRFGSGAEGDSWRVTLERGESLLDAPWVLKLDDYPGFEIPLDEEGNIHFSFAQHPSAFNAISAIDVMNGSIDTSMLENTWVLVGLTAFGMADIVPTPYDGATAGVELHARLLSSLLDVAVPYTPNGAIYIQLALCLLFASLVMAIATAEGRLSAYGLPAAALAMPLMAIALHGQLLAEYNFWTGWIYSALYGSLAAASILMLEQSRIRVERGRVFGNLNSYLPQELAREIAYALPSSSINARRTNATLLSADLRNFSAFGETRPPEESAAVLHYFFTRATMIIEQHHGRVHEFKGDGLLAVWDGADEQAAQQALAAAQVMQNTLDSLLPEQAFKGLEPLALGIGIEQGPVLVGSIGPSHRRTHTLLGDTVAIALRIQEMTAELAQPILLGECAARQLGVQELESQGSYLLSGLRTLHVLFAPLPTPDDSKTDGSGKSGKDGQPRLKVVAGGRA